MKNSGLPRLDRGSSQTHDATRRRFIGNLAGASATALLGGCAGIVGTHGSCDPPISTGINWIPDVSHPVFFGVAEIRTTDGAPRNMSIYYPAATFRNPSILKSCLAHWPVVLFLHGYTPPGIPPNDPDYYRRWWRIPAALARCGYVVVVPRQSYVPFFVPSDSDVADAMSTVDWVRNDSPFTDWIDQRPGATAVIGHSDGAMLAAAVAAKHGEIAAMISLGGVFPFNQKTWSLPCAVKTPSLYMWGAGSNTSGEEDMDAPGPPCTWDKLSQPRYALVYQGEHFDYLEPGDSGSAPRGRCGLIGGVAADLAALYISSNLNSLTRVPINLTKPNVSLTPLQQVYADSSLLSLDAFARQSECIATLRWKVDDQEGHRDLHSFIPP